MNLNKKNEAYFLTEQPSQGQTGQAGGDWGADVVHFSLGVG